MFESLQWAAGFWTFWYPGGSRSGRAFLLLWHFFFGIFMYVLAITSVTGLLEKPIFINSKGMLLVMLSSLVAIVIVMLGSLNPARSTHTEVLLKF